jgi:hypothetical protein
MNNKFEKKHMTKYSFNGEGKNLDVNSDQSRNRLASNLATNVSLSYVIVCFFKNTENLANLLYMIFTNSI